MSHLNKVEFFYVGVGTSGRIGILDAAECPPTFSTPPDMVQSVMASGNQSFMRAVEGAEDDDSIGEADLKERDLTEIDVVVGISASGRTPYVTGALKYAQSIGASTVSLTSNAGARISKHADEKVSNFKLKERAKNIIATITDVSVEDAGAMLDKTNLEVKPAIVIIKADVDYKKAKELIQEANGFIRQAIAIVPKI